MIPGGRMNPRQMKHMMKRMGIESEEIDVFWRRVDWIRELQGFPSLDQYSGARWP